MVLHSFFLSLAVPLSSPIVAACLILLSFPLGSLSFCLSFSFFFIQKILMMEIIRIFPVLFLFDCFTHSGFFFLSS